MQGLIHLPNLAHCRMHHFIDGDQLHTVFLAALACGMEADTAIKALVDHLRWAATRSPLRRVRRAKECYDRCADRCRDMHGTAVVPNKQRRALEQRGQRSDGGKSGNGNETAFCLSHHQLCHFGFLLAPSDKDLATKPLDQAIRQFSKSFGRPSLEPITGPWLDDDEWFVRRDRKFGQQFFSPCFILIGQPQTRYSVRRRNFKWYERRKIPFNSMRPCLAKHNSRIAPSGPALLCVESDTDGCSTDPAKQRRSVPICQIHDHVKASMSDIRNEPTLIKNCSSFQGQYLVHIRISGQDLLRSSIDECSQPRHGIGRLQRVQGRSRQKYVPEVAQFDDQNVLWSHAPRASKNYWQSDEYNSNVFAAARCQLYCFTRRNPFSLSDLRSDSLSKTFVMAVPNSRAFCGSTNTAASPATSPRAVVFEVTTGAPQPIASKTGMPNPS